MRTLSLILFASTTLWTGDFGSYERHLSSYYDQTTKQMLFMQYAKTSKGLFVKSEKTDRSVFSNVILWRPADERKILLIQKDGPSEIYKVIFESRYDKKTNHMQLNVKADEYGVSIYATEIPERPPADFILITGKNANDEDKMDLWLASKTNGNAKRLAILNKFTSVSISVADRLIIVLDVNENGDYTPMKFPY